MRLKDLTGQKFGRLTVIERAPNNKHGQVMWRCKCECGNERIVYGGHLRDGQTESCGCWNKQRISETHTKDLTGQVFGRLTVLERAGTAKRGKARWHCQCECGKDVVVTGSDLRSGTTKSCGCWHKEISVQMMTTHGLSCDRTNRIWCHIKDRCFNPNNKSYKNYGGRGITMYEPWFNDFKAFYEYVSQLEHFGKKGYSLDRIDNNVNYEPGNLRWATKIEQARNKNNNRIVEYEGEKMTLAEAAEKSGIPYYVLSSRIQRGWSEKNLFAPNQGVIHK